MSIKVEYDCLDSEAEALELLDRSGLHTMTIAVPPVRNESHWHHFDSIFLILEGNLELTDSDSGITHQCGIGTRITVPARALHSEYSAQGYRVALGTTVPASEFGEPVDRPPATLQAQ